MEGPGDEELFRSVARRVSGGDTFPRAVVRFEDVGLEDVSLMGGFTPFTDRDWTGAPSRTRSGRPYGNASGDTQEAKSPAASGDRDDGSGDGPRGASPGVKTVVADDRDRRLAEAERLAVAANDSPAAERQRQVWRSVEYPSLKKKLGQGSYGVVYEVGGMAVKPSCTNLPACLERQGQPVKENGPIWRVYSGEAVVGRNLTEQVPHPNVVRTELVNASNPEQDADVIEDGYDSANVTSELLEKWSSPEGLALGDMENWMKRLDGREQVRDWIPYIVAQVAHALHTIRRRFPSFRHNDLHTGNVFLSTWGSNDRNYRIGDAGFTVPVGCPRAVIIDFGVVTAKYDKELQAIDTASDALDWLDLYQISDEPSQWYDMLVFLADIQIFYGGELPVLSQVVDSLGTAYTGSRVQRRQAVRRTRGRGPDVITLYGDEPREIRPAKEFYEALDAQAGSFDAWLEKYVETL